MLTYVRSFPHVQLHVVPQRTGVRQQLGAERTLHLRHKTTVVFFFNTWTLLLFQNLLSQCVAPSEAVRKFSCCSGAGGGCVGTGGVRTPCRSAHTRKVFLRCGGPCAPSGPVSGHRPCHSGDRRRDAPRGDSTVNHTSIILHY